MPLCQPTHPNLFVSPKLPLKRPAIYTNTLANLVFRAGCRFLLAAVLFCFSVATNAQSDTTQLPADTLVQPVYVSAPDYFVINKIIIEGNRRTNARIIRRELDFLEGDSIPAMKVDSLLRWERNKIFNLNLFITVDVKLIKEHPSNAVDLHIKVKEQWYTVPQIIFELIDRNINVWVDQYKMDINRANVGVKLMQKNCRGRNETLRLTFKTGFTRNYALSYDIPYLNKKQKLGMMFGFDYSNNSNLAYGVDSNKVEFTNFTGTGLGIINNAYKGTLVFNYRNAFFTTHSWELSYYYNAIADTIRNLNPDYFLQGKKDQKYLYFRYSYNHDQRDVKQFAHKGRLFRFDFEQLGFSNWDSQQLTRLTFTYAHYTEIGKRFLFATRFKAKTSFPVFQPWYNFQGLGYFQDFVRGYELYAVDGQHYLMSRNSFRMKVFSRIWNFGKVIPISQFRTIPIDIYFTAFSDYGYVWRTQPVLPNFDNRLLSNKLMGCFGIGANIVSYYNSVMRFEYSYNFLGQAQFFFGMATDI